MVADDAIIVAAAHPARSGVAIVTVTETADDGKTAKVPTLPPALNQHHAEEANKISN